MLDRSSTTLVLFTATACNTLLFEQSEDATDSTAMTSSGVADGTSTTTPHPTSTSTPEATGADSSTSTTTGPTTTTGPGTTTGSDVTSSSSTSDPGKSDTGKPDGDTPYQYVFVTSEKWRGDKLEGLAGADAKCEAAAVAAGLPDLTITRYRAWISQEVGDAESFPEDATDRFPHPDTPYILVNGPTVASGWWDLTDGALASPINRTEHGTPASEQMGDPFWVWTNTQTSGEDDGFADCFSWEGLGKGRVGDANKSDGDWTSSHYIECADQAHLYCIEIDCTLHPDFC